MERRTCTIPGCENKHRARGLCSTHYNATRYTTQERHPRVVTACVVCSCTVTRRLDAKYRATCSVRCRAIVQWGEREAQLAAYDWRTDAQHRARAHGCHLIEDFDRVEIFERDDWTCYLCSVRCREPNPYDVRAATVDHVIPYHSGGQHTRANVKTCLPRVQLLEAGS